MNTKMLLYFSCKVYLRHWNALRLWNVFHFLNMTDDYHEAAKVK